MQIFSDVVKPVLIKKELWDDGKFSKCNQRATDMEVADTIRRSFVAHEKSAKQKNPDLVTTYFTV